ncbi:hypothetical protein YC2023_052430 [Brassica napus]
MLGRVVDAMGVPIDGRGALSDHEQRRVHLMGPCLCTDRDRGLLLMYELADFR